MITTTSTIIHHYWQQKITDNYRFQFDKCHIYALVLVNTQDSKPFKIISHDFLVVKNL